MTRKRKSRELMIASAIERIKDVEPMRAKEMVELVMKTDGLPFSGDIYKFLRNTYSINPRLEGRRKEYWVQRGWKYEDIQNKIDSIEIKPRSQFDYKYWMVKGLSEDESKFKANSIRPIRKEYWIVKGYSEEESVKLALETKSKNDSNMIGRSVNHTVRNKEYWMTSYGMSEEDAIQKVKEIQTTFSLGRCISKHGVDEGTDVWIKRQLKWQTTLKNKSNEELSNINIRKRGSKRCSEYMFLYITKIKFMDDEYVKVGISKDLTRRFSFNKNIGCVYDVVEIFRAGVNSAILEDDVISTFSDFRHIPPVKLDGYTEMFHISKLDDILRYAKNKFEEIND